MWGNSSKQRKNNSLQVLSAYQAGNISDREELPLKLQEVLSNIFDAIRVSAEKGYKKILYYFSTYTEMLEYDREVIIILRRLGYRVLYRETKSNYINPFGILLIEW